MAEEYFEIVDLKHFWVVRRFEVLRRIAGHLLQPALKCCEIGCGNGVLQRQLETELSLKVDGMELCLKALEENLSRTGILYYYNVFERRPELKETYDCLFLFDVLEHLSDDEAFLAACLFHLKPGGYVVINVPARMELFSKYDRLAGHARRYSIADFRRIVSNCGLQASALTYWGLPLYPILLVRKILMSCFDESRAYERGFTPMSALANSMLRALSLVELVPQRFLGTSILAVLRKSA